MIIEQAFQCLPELLCGSRYPVQDYEAGVVVALTMAILQELNGRNAPNPLSFIQGERLYDKKGFVGPADKSRYLRADLVVNTAGLNVSNSRLSRYGWRHLNWLEAKFFRKEPKATRRHRNKTANTAQLASDLIRLTTLVPETVGSTTPNGRYLLHVYDAEPSEYLARQKRGRHRSRVEDRRWVDTLLAPGSSSGVIEHLESEVQTLRSTVGMLLNLSVRFSLTNLVVGPTLISPGPVLYWCHLSRIDSFDVRLLAWQYAVQPDGLVTENMPGALENIRQYVGGHLGVPALEEEPPYDPPMEGECIRCGGTAPIECVTCSECGSDIPAGIGEEVYFIETGSDGRTQLSLPHSYGDSEDNVTCPNCGCEHVDVEFRSLCSGCSNLF